MALSRRDSFNSHLLYARSKEEIAAKTGMAIPVAKRVRDPNTVTEWHEQSAVIDWWDWWAPTQGYEARSLYAVPNGSYLGKDPKGRQITMMFLKRAGLRPGALDLNLDIPMNGLHGLRIEMKSVNGRESPDQIIYQGLHRKNGYAAEFCYGADDAIATIKGYLS